MGRRQDDTDDGEKRQQDDLSPRRHRVNIPPVLFSEVLADLEKAKGLATGTAEGDVRMLASKIISHSSG